MRNGIAIITIAGKSFGGMISMLPQAAFGINDTEQKVIIRIIVISWRINSAFY